MKPHRFSPENPLKIGTRGSALALAQANEVRDLLLNAHAMDKESVTVKAIKTSGDSIIDKPLSDIGGKGLFTKEIEKALLEGEIDIAVHSSKDMATELPEGLALNVFLPREDVRDVFIGREVDTLDNLAQGATIGSASLRRQAQLKRYRSDFNVIIFRGNVQTRLRKLGEGIADATLLAAAGLNRLKMADIASHYLEPEAFLPACGQGAICIETRKNDQAIDDFIHSLHDENTGAAIRAERAFLNMLDGSCRTPIAGLATIEGERLSFKGEVLRPDGSESYSVEEAGSIDNAIRIGEEAGKRLKSQLSADFLDTLQQR